MHHAVGNYTRNEAMEVGRLLDELHFRAFIEMPYPQGARDAQPYIKDLIRIAADGCVHAPTKPGLGFEIDRAALDRATTQIER
jgi:L-alanine-DL-glutamate epimerase-like enolase superfamily enzyme